MADLKELITTNWENFNVACCLDVKYFRNNEFYTQWLIMLKKTNYKFINNVYTVWDTNCTERWWKYINDAVGPMNFEVMCLELVEWIWTDVMLPNDGENKKVKHFRNSMIWESVRRHWRSLKTKQCRGQGPATPIQFVCPGTTAKIRRHKKQLQKPMVRWKDETQKIRGRVELSESDAYQIPADFRIAGLTLASDKVEGILKSNNDPIVCMDARLFIQTGDESWRLVDIPSGTPMVVTTSDIQHAPPNRFWHEGSKRRADHTLAVYSSRDEGGLFARCHFCHFVEASEASQEYRELCKASEAFLVNLAIALPHPQNVKVLWDTRQQRYPKLFPDDPNDLEKWKVYIGGVSVEDWVDTE